MKKKQLVGVFAACFCVVIIVTAYMVVIPRNQTGQSDDNMHSPAGGGTIAFNLYIQNGKGPVVEYLLNDTESNKVPVLEVNLKLNDYTYIILENEIIISTNTPLERPITWIEIWLMGLNGPTHMSWYLIDLYNPLYRSNVFLEDCNNISSCYEKQYNKENDGYIWGDGNLTIKLNLSKGTKWAASNESSDWIPEKGEYVRVGLSAYVKNSDEFNINMPKQHVDQIQSERWGYYSAGLLNEQNK